MSKVAIVGVEGSGKTVLMAALGELYGQASHESLYLMPENQAAFAFMTRIPHKMRVEHQWPEATAIESMKYMKWTVRVGSEVLTELEMLDYPGELYRMAFGDRKESEIESAKEQIHEFLEHLVTADFLIVLLNLKDAMDIGANARNNETVWLTRGIFDYAKKLSNITCRLLVFTQADRYHELLKGEGGPKSVQEKYMPMLSILHPDLECIAISAVEAPESNVPGAEPTTDGGLQELMARIVMASEAGQRAMGLMAKCQSAAKEATREYGSIQELDESIAKYGNALDQVGGTEAWIISSLYPGTLDDHSDRYGMLKEFAEDIHKVISANPISELAGNSPWKPLAEKYDGLSGQLASIRNIQNSFSKRNVHRTATILFVGFLIIILVAAIIGFQQHGRKKTIKQLVHFSGLSWDTSQRALQGNPDAQYEIGNALLSTRPAQDRAMAVSWLAKAAAQGHDLAQDKLCDFYYNASIHLDEIPRDAGTLQTFKKHADNGASWAQNIMGALHYYGLGVPKDMKEAQEWYQKSADAGNAYGMINIGQMYADDKGEFYNPQEATRWFKCAATLGNANAQCQLAELYLLGDGVERSEAKAKALFRQAANNGNIHAMARLGGMYLGKAYSDKPNTNDIIEAMTLLTEAADKGDATAQWTLGALSYTYSSNKADALRFLVKASNQGEKDASLMLAQMYENGEGVAQNDQEAFKWYQKAVAQGDSYSLYKIGNMYDAGRGIAQNVQEAIRSYRQAADQGDAAAQSRLGWCYANGHGVEKDDVEAVRLWRLSAEQGHAIAQYYLGHMYDEGRGVSQNDQEAFQWFLKAAEQGDADAQYDVGMRYSKGIGVSRDDTMAVKYWEMAAQQGSKVAQYCLGMAYDKGFGVPNNHGEAARWYRLAAEQGHVGAQYFLGLLFAKGLGVPRDDAVAVKYWNMASEQGDIDAQFMLGMAYEKGLGVPQNDIAATKWYRTAAEKGDIGAQLKMGYRCSSGLGLPKDEYEAANWFQLAADQGSSSAQYFLARRYAEGRGVPKDDDRAIKYMKMSAEQGDPDAEFNMGWRYDNGEGVSRNNVEAAKWYMRAAEQGHANAQYNLGVMYDKGQGVPQNITMAINWWKKAADQGYASAQYNLGVTFANGDGVPRNISEAIKWYQLAAKQGDVNARQALQKIGYR